MKRRGVHTEPRRRGIARCGAGSGHARGQGGHEGCARKLNEVASFHGCPRIPRIDQDRQLSPFVGLSVKVVCVLWVGGSALAIRHLTRRYNFFHALAVLSLVMVVGNVRRCAIGVMIRAPRRLNGC